MNNRNKTEFEKIYNDWKSYIKGTDISEFSSDEVYINNKYFYKIISLGKPILPLIVDRMKEDPNAHFLIHAMEKISGHQLSKEEIAKGIETYGTPLGNQTLAKIWISWWERQSVK